jgi:HTH-type transcriptional regulator, quorum sensing regulator NprR
MKFGARIKFYRAKLMLSQKELAEGIISIPYLSKIENNQVVPAPEITKLLLNRLGLPIDDFYPESYSKVLSNFYKAIQDKDITAADAIYDFLSKEDLKVIGKEKLFLIYSIGYKLLFKEMNDINSIIQNLDGYKLLFSDEESYYFNKLLGDYFYEVGNYKKSLGSYQLAEGYRNRIGSTEEEYADLLYAISLAASKLWNVELSIDYGKQALSFFQANYNLIRCIHCHVLLGISFKRLNQHEKALKSYTQALTLAKKIDEKDIQGVIYQNIGYVNYLNNNLEEAISNYQNAIKIKNDNKSRLVTIRSLLRAYYDKNDLKNLEFWIQQGEQLLGEENSEEDKLTFSVFKYLINKEGSSLEYILTQEVIPFYEKRDDHKSLSYYLEILANYYTQSRKYKQATQQYKKIILCLRK